MLKDACTQSWVFPGLLKTNVFVFKNTFLRNKEPLELFTLA